MINKIYRKLVEGPSPGVVFSTEQAAGTRTDRSGTITAGGTAQSLMVARAGRFGYQIINTSSEVFYVNDLGATATTSSRPVQPGATYESPPNDRPIAAISILGATTGQSFSAYEY